MDFLKWFRSSLTRLWKKWLPIAQAIGNFQAQVILTIFYFVIVAPLGVGLRLFADPLRVRKKAKSNFQRWEHPKETLETARRQY